VTRVLDLLLPLLSLCDPPLHAFLCRSGVLPYFALTWVLTWHVHESASASNSARLFDLFISSSPLMPLYVGIAAMMQQRAVVLALPCEAPEVHQFLSRLNVLEVLTADELAARALALHREHPPAALLGQGIRLPSGSAAEAWPFPFVQSGAKSGGRKRFRRALVAAVLAGGSVILRALLAAG